MSSSNPAAARTARAPEPSDVPLHESVRSASPETLIAAASDPSLTEDLALVLLKRSDLPTQVLDRLSRNAIIMKSRKVKLALVEHPRTPRHISVPMVRHLFTFDLMQVALTPVVPTDIKMSAEESLINRLERLSQGERLSLARRASGRIAAALLIDSETRVIHAALENSRLTESAVIKALMHRNAPAAFVRAVCDHEKWAPRREVRTQAGAGTAQRIAGGALPPVLLVSTLAPPPPPFRLRGKLVQMHCNRLMLFPVELARTRRVQRFLYNVRSFPIRGQVQGAKVAEIVSLSQ